MRAWLTLLLAAGCGFRIGGGAQPDGGDSPDDAHDAADAPPDEAPPLDGARGDWWDARWKHRRSITIDNTKLAGDVGAFPVLIRLPATFSYADVRPNGDDLRFIADDQVTELPYAIDTYIATTESTLWVSLSLTKTGPKPRIWLYYGNVESTPPPPHGSGPGVFAAGHVSVNHLGDGDDATGHGHTAAGPVAQTPLPVAGEIGGAQSFSGAGQFLELANSDTAYDFGTTMYASAWVKHGAFAPTDSVYQAIVCKGDTAWRMHRGNAGNGAGFGTTSGTQNDNLDGTMTIADNKWHHVAVVMDGAMKHLYLDGKDDGSTPYTAQLDNNARSVRIGMNDEAQTAPLRYWNGQIDEVRISSTARDVAWVKAEFTTANDDNFAKLGMDEPY